MKLSEEMKELFVTIMAYNTGVKMLMKWEEEHRDSKLFKTEIWDDLQKAIMGIVAESALLQLVCMRAIMEDEGEKEISEDNKTDEIDIEKLLSESIKENRKEGP